MQEGRLLAFVHGMGGSVGAFVHGTELRGMVCRQPVRQRWRTLSTPGGRAGMQMQMQTQKQTTTRKQKKKGRRPVAEHEHGTTLRKDETETQTRRGGSYKTRRWATLDELDIKHSDFEDLGTPHPTTKRVGKGAAATTTTEYTKDWDGSQRVQIWMVASRTPAGADDVVVRGRAVTIVPRTCDRCLQTFDAEADGRFDVLLAGSEERAEDATESADYEAVELFAGGVDAVDMASHARDAVLLGLPTRADCGQCDSVGSTTSSDDQTSA